MMNTSKTATKNTNSEKHWRVLATHDIHPEALKHFRKQRHMGQEQLAEAVGCTKDTISRWERGQSKRVRSHLQEPLCKALHAKGKDLITAPKKSDEMPEKLLQVKVRPQIRTALQLVARRYGVDNSVVVEFAPLLFLIVAELSLLERRAQLKRIKEQVGLADDELERSHLDANLAIHSEDELNLAICCDFDSEIESIEKRDVFGLDLYQDDNKNNQGPLINFIRALASELPKDALSRVSRGDVRDCEVDYRIANDTLCECTELSEENEEDKGFLRWIQAGYIDLNECLRVKRDRDGDGYRQWRIEERKAVPARLIEGLSTDEIQELKEELEADKPTKTGD